MAMRSVKRRPWISAILPYSGMIAVDASRYAVISHGRLCTSPKARRIVGSAVARMVWSSAPMKCRQQHAEDDQPRLSMREGLALTAVGVGIHRQWCSGPELARSALRAVALGAC